MDRGAWRAVQSMVSHRIGHDRVTNTQVGMEMLKMIRNGTPEQPLNLAPYQPWGDTLRPGQHDACSRIPALEDAPQTLLCFAPH